MALKQNWLPVVENISRFMDQVGERGGVVVIKTSGSGAAMDQSENEVEYVADSSGTVPFGLLLNDVVDVDLTRYELNKYKNEEQKGGKVTLLRDGWAVTNMIVDGVTIAGGETAYLGVSGLLTNVGGNNPQVGQWETSKDEDGYAKVYVKLPK